jgi:hypothetical protein
MRKTAIALLALGLAAVVAGPASAAAFWSETFSYAAGPLPANSGGNWTTHSGAGTDVAVVSGYAHGDMLQAPDHNRTFVAQGAGAKTYACMQVRIPSITGAPRPNYFAHFKDTGTFNFAARLAVVPSGSTFTFGIGSTTSTFTNWATALNYDEWYTVAIAYDAAAGSADLWVNPSSESSTKVTSAGGSTGFLVSAFALRQSSTGTGTAWMFDVDNVMVGDNFNDLCPNPTPANNTTWGRLKTLYR